MVEPRRAGVSKPHPVFIKFYWDTAMHICLCIVYGWLCATAELSLVIVTDCMAHKV